MLGKGWKNQASIFKKNRSVLWALTFLMRIRNYWDNRNSASSHSARRDKSSRHIAEISVKKFKRWNHSRIDKTIIIKRIGGKMYLKVLIIIGGIYHLSWAVFHIFWPKVFNWKQALANLDFINRSLMHIQSIFLLLMFFIFSFISIFHVNEMISTSLGLTLIASFSLFWLIRIIVQIKFFGYKDKISVFFLILFLFGFIIHLVPFLILL